MVGGLIQQQRRWVTKQRLRQQYPNLLTALQFAHLALVQCGFDTQSVEQHRGVRLRRVTVLFADNSFELAQTDAFFFGNRVVGFGVQRVPLFQGFPKR